MKNFECKRCGRCCIHSIPQFERDEYLRVKDKAEAMGIKFIGLRLQGVDTYFTSKTFYNFIKLNADTKRGIKMTGEPVFNCEFLRFENGLAGCAIYDQRPIVCREFGNGSRPEQQCIYKPK